MEELGIADPGLSDTNAVLLDYPEMTLQRFAIDCVKQLPEHAKNVQLVLRPRRSTIRPE